MSGPDRWSGGDAYERYVGRWSRQVGPIFVDWLALAAGRRWLDVGCGTGALSATVLARAEPASVIGVDPSADFVEHARASGFSNRAVLRYALRSSLNISDAPLLVFAPAAGDVSGKIVYEPLLQ